MESRNGQCYGQFGNVRGLSDRVVRSLDCSAEHGLIVLRNTVGQFLRNTVRTRFRTSGPFWSENVVLSGNGQVWSGNGHEWFEMEFGHFRTVLVGTGQF